MTAHAKHAPVDLKVSTLAALPAGANEVGVVYASVEGVNNSYDECFAELAHKAQALGQRAWSACSWCKVSSKEPAHKLAGNSD